MRALLDILSLSVLTPKLIATNQIEDKNDKKTGGQLTTVLARLHEYFRDTPAFVQDLENIEATLTQKENLGSQRRLAMLITDDPQILLQIGKYPIGCGSCQNYEGDPGHNIALTGYLADAHSKAMLMIDLKKLPKAVLERIEVEGFDAVKKSITSQEILEAAVGRSIAKLVRVPEGEPVLFLEPTYSVMNKGDHSMDRLFDIFAKLAVCEPMGIRLVRGEGRESVHVPSSRSPGGQYEDCAAGNAGHAGMGIKVGDYYMPAKFIS
jgi:hypothetical protein